MLQTGWLALLPQAAPGLALLPDHLHRAFGADQPVQEHVALLESLDHALVHHLSPLADLEERELGVLERRVASRFLPNFIPVFAVFAHFRL